MLHETIATTILSATQRCNIAATLFRMVTTLFQHCNAVLPQKSSSRIVPCNITLRSYDADCNNNRFNKQNNNFAHASHFFVHVFPVFCTTTTWKCLISRFKVMLARDDSQRPFSAQHSLAMLEQCCKHSKQCRNNAVVLFCTEKKKIKSKPCLRQKSRKTYPGWPHVLIKPL